MSRFLCIAGSFSEDRFTVPFLRREAQTMKLDEDIWDVQKRR